MARKSQARSKGETAQYRTHESSRSPATPRVSYTTSDMGTVAPVSPKTDSALIEDFYGFKKRLEQLSADCGLHELTAEQLIDELGDYSQFMHRFLDRRQYGSSLMKLHIPDKIQQELEKVREHLEDHCTDLVMRYLSEQAIVLIRKSETHPRSIGLELDFSMVGRQIIYACATICIHNADINRQEWQRFVPRCINHNIHITINQLFEAHKRFQTSLYLQNGVERVKLWYLLWKSLRKIFELLQRNEDRFPSIDYCVESSFFRTKEIRNLFEYSAHQADFFIPEQIEDIVGYYCQLIHEHHSQIKPKSGHLRGLSGKNSLPAKAILALSHFSEQHLWQPVALKALHWATIRLNHLTAGPVVLRRRGAKIKDWAYETTGNQEILKQLTEDTEDEIQYVDFGLPSLSEKLGAVDQNAEEVAMDIDDILSNDNSTHTRVRSMSAGRQGADAFSGKKPSSPSVLPRHLADNAHNIPATLTSFPEHAVPLFPALTRTCSSSHSQFLSSSGGSRRSSLHRVLSTPRTSSFASLPRSEVGTTTGYRAVDDIESQDSVSMEISPTSEGVPQAIDSTVDSQETNARHPTEDQDMLVESQTDREVNADKFIPQWPEPRGRNQVSAYDYVHCPFPENRKYEVANSRLISRDLRTPGIVSDGLRIRDLINLPPAHCRTPGTFTFWKKRTPLGPYEVLKLFGSALADKLVRRKDAATKRPRFPPSVTSRASCRHYKHVLGAKWDAQRRVAKPVLRGTSVLKGGGIRRGRGFPKVPVTEPADSRRSWRVNSQGSPVPTEPRQQSQNGSSQSPYTGEMRPQPQLRPEVIELTRDDEHEENDFDIHEDDQTNSPSQTPRSSDRSSNKENAVKHERAGLKGGPLTERGIDKTSSGTPSTPPLPEHPPPGVRREGCHPCPVYQGQYHHYCLNNQGGICGNEPPHSSPAIGLVSGSEASPFRGADQRLLLTRNDSNAPDQDNVDLFNSRLRVWVVEEGAARELIFRTAMTDMLSDHLPPNSIIAVEDGSMFVLRTVPGDGRALTAITELVNPIACHWQFQPAVWRSTVRLDHPVDWEVTPRALLPTNHPGGLLRFDENDIGRIYQLANGDIIRAVLFDEQIDIQILIPNLAPDALPPPFGNLLNDSTVPAWGTPRRDAPNRTSLPRNGPSAHGLP